MVALIVDAEKLSSIERNLAYENYVTWKSPESKTYLGRLINPESKIYLGRLISPESKNYLGRLISPESKIYLGHLFIHYSEHL